MRNIRIGGKGKMERTEQIKKLLDYFLHQDTARKVESDDGSFKIYKIGDNLIRVDIKITKKEEE